MQDNEHQSDLSSEAKQVPKDEAADAEEVNVAAHRILEQHRKAFDELAK